MNQFRYEVSLFKHRAMVKWRKFKKKLPNLRIWWDENKEIVLLNLAVTLAAAVLGFMVGALIAIVLILRGF